MKKPIHGPVLVAAAVIERERPDHQLEYLIGQRLASSKVEGAKWEFPGGKVEAGEAPFDSVRRELHEELNMDLEVSDLVGAHSHVYDFSDEQIHVVLLFYRCRLRKEWSAPKTLPAHSEVRWVMAADFSKYEWAVADLPIVDALRK